MLRTKIPIQTAGVYIYRAGKQVWLDEVDRQMVVVLACPSKQVAGIIVYPDTFVRGELFDLLNSVRDKLCKELAIPTDAIQGKIFGCSAGQTNALFAAQVWLTDQKFQIAAMDIGRNVTRNLVVDTKSGKVGVRFADAETSLGAGFLKGGTAAHRAGVVAAATERSAIVVTDNKNFGLLASQSLDSAGGWTVKTMTSKELSKAPSKFRLAWLKTTNVVVVLEDVLETKNLGRTIIALRKKNPDIHWLWSVADGTSVPLPLDAIPLPSTDIPAQFARQIGDVLALPRAPIAQVISLREVRKSRR